ncbi:hypothetical protein IAT38_001062 [Cryptococcus sp. DSM 104549]
MDDDFEDLLHDVGGVSCTPPDEDCCEEPQTASTSRTIDDSPPMPTENEIRLGRRVLELEREKDSLAAELAAIKSRFPTHSGPTVAVPAIQVTSTPDQPSHPPAEPPAPIDIPPSLLPVLSLLRSHIADLTRDNQALRYTFLGQAIPRRGPITQTPTPVVASTPTMPAQLTPNVAGSADVEMSPAGGEAPQPSAPGMQPGPGVGGVDLERVVDRVRELVRENEELGEMLVDVGKRESEEDWKMALEDYQTVIKSLDSDLAHNLSVVKSTRTELSAYKNHFGPLPASGLSAPTQPSSHRPSPSPSAGSGRGSSHSTPNGERANNEADRNRDRGRGSQAGRGKGERGSTPVSGFGQLQGQGARTQGPTQNGTGHVRSGSASQGQALKLDDRSIKRRR